MIAFNCFNKNEVKICWEPFSFKNHGHHYTLSGEEALNPILVTDKEGRTAVNGFVRKLKEDIGCGLADPRELVVCALIDSPFVTSSYGERPLRIDDGGCGLVAAMADARLILEAQDLLDTGVGSVYQDWKDAITLEPSSQKDMRSILRTAASAVIEAVDEGRPLDWRALTAEAEQMATQIRASASEIKSRHTNMTRIEPGTRWQHSRFPDYQLGRSELGYPILAHVSDIKGSFADASSSRTIQVMSFEPLAMELLAHEVDQHIPQIIRQYVLAALLTEDGSLKAAPSTPLWPEMSKDIATARRAYMEPQSALDEAIADASAPDWSLNDIPVGTAFEVVDRDESR